MLRVAVIGAGIMGSIHARTISKLPVAKLVAICDSDYSKAKKAADLYNSTPYSDFDELLHKQALDAVIIAVPTRLHKEISIKCIKEGINVLVEKPLAISFKDAQEIVTAAKRKNVVLTIGHTERFNPAILKLKELIKNGTFGDIISIVIKRVGLFPPRVSDVDVVTDLAVHDLDIVCDLLNNYPLKIFASGGSSRVNSQFDHADILLSFGKANCYLQVNWLTPIKVRTLAITGISGYCELNYITQEVTLYKSKFKLPIPMPKKFENFVKKLGHLEKSPVKVHKEEPLKLELSNFFDAISKKNTVEVTPEQGLNAVKLSEMVLKSISEGKVVNYEK